MQSDDRQNDSTLGPDQLETWSTMHALVLDSTKMSEQRQTASIALGRGSTKTYSTGDIIDGTYRLLWLLGTGGMGVVFHCQHIMLGKEYALKILAADSITLDSWNRFQSEAKALARLHHPGVVSIHNMGIDNQQCPYYVMDLLSGQSLAQIIEQKHRLPVDQAVKIFIQLADALDAAHQQDIIHRDIKPSNVMVYQESGKERVKIVDFGIARLNTGRHNYILKTEVESQNQTMAGAVFGTPYYMSPEQGAGQPLDHRS
ncbi:MAG: serine/threonine protein kinase, partial [Candidatus Obscuribacter sp.]|nr:serine/threonine protein kinase [Candidatus Obscuribacter sp.]